MVRRYRSESGKVYERMVDTTGGPFLESLGFRRSRFDAFRRLNGDCVQHIYLSFSKDSFEDYGFVNVYGGVGFKKLAKFLKELDVQARWLSQASSTRYPYVLADSLDNLNRSGAYDRFLVTPETCPKELGNRVTEEIHRYMLLFLDKHSSLDTVLSQWRSLYKRGRLGISDRILLAAGLWLAGEHEQSLRLANETLERTEERSRSPRSGEVYYLPGVRDFVAKLQQKARNLSGR